MQKAKQALPQEDWVWSIGGNWGDMGCAGLHACTMTMASLFAETPLHLAAQFGGHVFR